MKYFMKYFIILFIFLAFVIVLFILYCILVPTTAYDQLLEDEEQMKFLSEYERQHKKKAR